MDIVKLVKAEAAAMVAVAEALADFTKAKDDRAVKLTNRFIALAKGDPESEERAQGLARYYLDEAIALHS